MRVIACSLILVAISIVACRQTGSDSITKGESFRSFAPDGGWCWFSDPRAVHYKGQYNRTYAGWVNSSGDIEIASYDHDREHIETKVLHANLEVDDHDNPSLIIDKDGKLLVFYSKHAHEEPILLMRSVNAEDISSWEPVRRLALNDSVTYAGLSDTYTYASLCRLADENDKLFLFWRGADFKPNFSVSADNGNNWSTGRIMILPERIYHNRRPYFKIASNGKNTIHFAFTDGHPNMEPTNSVYYAAYRDSALYKANGERIMDWSALPLQPRQADVVYDAAQTNEKAWIWDIAEDEEGNPVMVYTRFPNDSTHVYYYSLWNEGTWNNYELVNSGSWFPKTPEGVKEREPNYSGGIVLDHQDPSIVYLSREKNGVFEIEKWTTADNGKNWTTREITRDSEHDNVRPFVIRNYDDQDSLRVLWLNITRYTHYTDYQTSVKMNILDTTK
jgi:hypothetical protein